MSEFKAKLEAFLKAQKGNNPAKVETETSRFVQSEVVEYVPKERWGNVLKWMVGNALAYGIGINLAAAIVRGASGLIDQSTANDLAHAVESGFLDNKDDFDHFAEGSLNLGSGESEVLFEESLDVSASDLSSKGVEEIGAADVIESLLG
jgi:hypothetical protein